MNDESQEIIAEVKDILGSAVRNINVNPEMSKQQISNCIKKLNSLIDEDEDGDEEKRRRR